MEQKERELRDIINKLNTRVDELVRERNMLEEDATRYKELFFYMCDGYQELQARFEHKQSVLPYW